MTWEEFWISFKDFFTTRGWPIVEAILVFICGFIIVKIIMKIIRTAFKRSKMERITQTFLLSIIKYSLYLTLILIVLQIYKRQICRMRREALQKCCKLLKQVT